MRFAFTLLIVASISAWTHAQTFFPVKINKKWGLINSDGELVTDPIYEAIGEARRFGYSVMQRDGKVGLLNGKGEEMILPEYSDLKVLDSTIIAVYKNETRWVINLQGKTILEPGYGAIETVDQKYITYTRGGLWGVIDYDGNTICRPSFDNIQLLPEGYFLTHKDKLDGLITTEGKQILPNRAEEIRIYNDNLFFYRNTNGWGAVDQSGKNVIPDEFVKFRRVSDNFVQLYGEKNSLSLYSMTAQKIISRGQFDGFYPFSSNFVLCKIDRKLGLMDGDGEHWLSARYDEIQTFAENQFRVKFSKSWGVMGRGDETIIPLSYDYIAPLSNRNCVVKNGYFFGLLNYKGEPVVPTEYSRIELSERQAKGYKGEALSLFYMDEEGLLQDESNFKKHYTISIGKNKRTRIRRSPTLGAENDYTLENFEWFYSSNKDKWGLRKLEDGSEQIEPKFDWIQVERNYGFTIVGIEKFDYYSFERTTFRFEMIYGVVNNEVGLLVTEVDLWDIRLRDFERGYPMARVVYSNGRQRLMSRKTIGLMTKKDYAFIGEFRDGVARMSMKGRMSGSFKNKKYGLGYLSVYLNQFLSTNYMVDYTIYDQEFEDEAEVICEGCLWGYIDTIGEIRVQPQFSFAHDFVSDVGIVQSNGKWGVVDRDENILVPIKYDGVHFLENTNNGILRVYNNQQKYGLIDTFGHVTVNLNYDKIGAFREGRLAVKRNGFWGFVDKNGREVIPCRFQRVKNFNESLSVVKLGNKWGVIDPQGNVVINFSYTRLGNFKSGKAWAYTSRGACYINVDNEIVIPPRYNKTYDFEGRIARVVVNGKYGLIDEKGNYILRPRYTRISEFDEHGLAVVQLGQNRIRYALLNRQGKIVTKQKFRKIMPFSEGYAAVKYKDAYGYINLAGDLVISAKYSKVADFSEGRAAVQYQGLCGYIDTEGEEVVNLAFSKCLDFEDGKAVVYKGYRRGGLIDLNGNFIIEPSVNRLFEFNDGRGLVRDSAFQFYYITENASKSDAIYRKAGNYQHGVAVVQSKTNGQWGVINQKGIALISPKYDKIEKFQDGYARVRIRQFSGLSNLSGDLIVKPDYEYISYAGNGLFRVERGDKIGYFDALGNWVWALEE